MFLQFLVTNNTEMKVVKLIPTWFVANCSSIPSFESKNGVAITPALLLPTVKER